MHRTRIPPGHDLKPHNRQDNVAWVWPESVFNSDYDIVSDMGKARRPGFHDSLDTRERFLRMFSEFRRNASSPKTKFVHRSGADEDKSKRDEDGRVVAGDGIASIHR